MNHDCIEGACNHGITDAGEVVDERYIKRYETPEEFWARLDKLDEKRRFYGKYALYILRWQLSTPILAITLILLGGLGEIPAAIIANLIGGLIFFWVDRLIFGDKK